MMEGGREGSLHILIWLGILGELRCEVNMHAYTRFCTNWQLKRGGGGLGFEKYSVILVQFKEKNTSDIKCSY